MDHRQGSAFFESLFRNEIDPTVLFESTARMIIRVFRTATHASSVLSTMSAYASHDEDGLLHLGSEHAAFMDHLLERATGAKLTPVQSRSRDNSESHIEPAPVVRSSSTPLVSGEDGGD